MSKTSEIGSDPSRRSGVTLAVSVLALLSLLFWIDDALPYLDFSEGSYGRFWDRSGWLLSHVLGGSLALLMGPFQFWSGLRGRYPSAHPWTGRLYVAGVVVAAASALPLAFQTESWTFGVALFVGNILWLATTALALLAALRRRIEAHRAWALRSYILTFAFVSFRLILEIPFIEQLESDPELSTTICWLSWAVPLLVYEFFRQVRQDRFIP